LGGDRGKGKTATNRNAAMAIAWRDVTLGGGTPFPAPADYPEHSQGAPKQGQGGRQRNGGYGGYRERTRNTAEIAKILRSIALSGKSGEASLGLEKSDGLRSTGGNRNSETKIGDTGYRWWLNSVEPCQDVANEPRRERYVNSKKGVTHRESGGIGTVIGEDKKYIWFARLPPSYFNG